MEDSAAVGQFRSFRTAVRKLPSSFIIAVEKTAILTIAYLPRGLKPSKANLTGFI